MMVMACVAVLAVTGCKKSADVASKDAKSMEMIHAEKGTPVTVRTVSAEPFSVSLKFPATYQAVSTATERSKMHDVVRAVEGKVGDHVEKDQVLVRFSDDDANYLQAKLSVDNAEQSFRRISALHEQDGVSQQDYDNASTQLAIARQKLRQLEDMLFVKSPIAGTVVRMDARSGAGVNQGDLLFTITGDEGYEAVFPLLPAERGLIEIGDKAVIQTADGPQEGQVSDISLSVDAMTRSFKCKARFPGQSPLLSDGMQVDLTVVSYGNAAAVVVKQGEYAVDTDGTPYAFVVEGDRAVRRNLTLGREENMRNEVLSGLETGDTLVTDGTGRINDGDKVQTVR